MTNELNLGARELVLQRIYVKKISKKKKNCITINNMPFTNKYGDEYLEVIKELDEKGLVEHNSTSARFRSDVKLREFVEALGISDPEIYEAMNLQVEPPL